MNPVSKKEKKIREKAKKRKRKNINSVWKPVVSDIDCDSNQTEVVLLIFIRIKNKSSMDELQLSLLPFIRQNNYKISILDFIAYGYYDDIDRYTFLLIKTHLQAHQKVKIILFSHFSLIYNCLNLMDILQQLKYMQLPSSPNNLGLVLLENGEPEKWDMGDKRFNIDMFPNLEFIYMENGLAWDQCVDLSYRFLKCEKYGCPALKILTNKDTANRYTNIVLVKMTKEGQLIKGKEELETFINDRLQFTSLTVHDVQIFHPKTFKKLHNFHQQLQELLLQRLKESTEALDPVLIRLGRAWFISKNMNVARKIALDNNYQAFMKKRSKRQSLQRLTDNFLFRKILSLANSLMTMSDRNSMRILNALLEILHRIYSEYDRKKKEIICTRTPKVPRNHVIAYEMITDEVLVRNFIVLFAVLRTFSDYEYIEKKICLKQRQKINKYERKLARADCEKILQILLADFTKNWYTPAEKIETSVDRLTKKLTQWADKVPIHENETVMWDAFSKWTGTDAVLLAKINVSEIMTLFDISQDGGSTDIDKKFINDFHWMLRELLFSFNVNVTTVAIQRLAISKLERVDAVVAVLDRSFMAGIIKIQQSIDREQWATIRPQISEYMLKIQRKTQNFDHFVTVTKTMFVIHDIHMPMASYERLQDVKAEFDVYQAQMGGYINGSINTTQQWGRQFHETVNYIYKNSGTQQKSFINGAVKWIKGEVMFERKPTWSGLDLEATLVLINLIVRKFLKDWRNFW